MANNEIKTNAEIYREQRKARLEKASKKKHSAKRDKAVRIVVKTLAILLCTSLALYFAGSLLLNVFYVPQKIVPVVTFGEDDKLSGAEYNYYYMALYSQIRETAYQYESMYSSYGSGYGVYLTGFDYTIDPAEQDYPATEEENLPETVVTWSDYFAEMAPTRAYLMRTMYKKAMSEEAKKAGFALTDEEKTEIQTSIDEQIQSLADTAKENNYSLDSYISLACGEGLTEKTYREFLERDLVVDKYITWYQENVRTTFSDKDVEAYFNENKENFVSASARIFAVTYAAPQEGSTDPAYTKEDAEKIANEFLSKLTTEDTFVSLSKEYAPPSLKESYEADTTTLLSDVSAADVGNETVTNWLFSEERQISDKTVLHDEETESYYIIYVVKPAQRDESPAFTSVRHILISAETTDASGNALSQDKIDANLAAAKTEADKLLQTWKDNGATEDAFVALVADNTDDTGSIQTGGLYDDVSASSNYVPEFKNWAINPVRKAGDVEIVKTEFGYHLMYFVSASEYATWENAVREEMGSNDYSELIDGIVTDYDEIAKTQPKLLDFYAKRMKESISLNY